MADLPKKNDENPNQKSKIYTQALPVSSKISS